jgi:hypothetical protein
MALIHFLSPLADAVPLKERMSMTTQQTIQRDDEDVFDAQDDADVFEEPDDAVS